MWTVINFIKRFFIDLVFAAKFAAQEYDEKIKVTKTPKERAIIWIFIGSMTLFVIYVILRLLAGMLFSIARFNEKILPQ